MKDKTTLWAEAERAIKHARTQLVLSHPFFGHLALRQALVPTDAIPTLMTDGNTIHYNPHFFMNECTDNLRLSAIAHEVMHGATLTLERRGNRDSKIWNIATDHANNLILEDAGFEIGEDWACDKRFTNMTADEIYSILLHEEQKGHACGWIGESNKKLSSGEIKALEGEMRTILAQAAQAAKVQGQLPGGVARFVERLLNPTINWRTMLQHLAERIAHDDYSWEYPDRAYMQQGFYIPSLHNRTLGEIVVAIDTSGSVSQRELSTFAAELSGVLQQAQPELVHVLYIDTQVQEVETFTPHDLPLTLTAKGGGGTRFTPAFDWVEKQGVNTKALIYFTDLFSNKFPKTPPSYPVIWATMGEGMRMQIPFGDKIEITLD